MPAFSDYFELVRTDSGQALALDRNPILEGNYARVYTVRLRSERETQNTYAFKVMRHKHCGKEQSKTFYVEALVFQRLTELKLDPQLQVDLVKLVKLGFIYDKENPENDLPQDDAELDIFDLNQIDEYLKKFNKRLEEGWRPYLVLEQKIYEHSLGLKPRHSNGRAPEAVLSLPDWLLVMRGLVGLCVALLQHMVIYHDHKRNHMYYHDSVPVLYVIDLNCSHLMDDLSTIKIEQLKQEEVKNLLWVGYELLTGHDIPSWDFNPDKAHGSPKWFNDLVEDAFKGEICDANALYERLFNFTHHIGSGLAEEHIHRLRYLYQQVAELPIIADSQACVVADHLYDEVVCEYDNEEREANHDNSYLDHLLDLRADLSTYLNSKRCQSTS